MASAVEGVASTATPPNQPLNSRPRHRAYIQGLRAIAVIMVIAAHAGLPIPGGFSGVDLFFVISGFVITLGLLREIHTYGRINLVRFYVRRFRRLTPALAVMVTFTCVAGMLLVSPYGPQRSLAWTAAGTSFLSANFVIADVSKGYFAARAQMNPLLHTWSLSVEEQFYLLFPFALALGWRWTRRRWSVFALCGGLAAISAAVMGLNVGGDLLLGRVDFAGYYGPLPRLGQFAAGCAVAAAVTYWPAARGCRRWTLAWWLGLVSIAVCCWGMSEASQLPGPVMVLPVVAAVLVMLGGEYGVTGVSRPLESSWLVRTGDMSYSLYLWHWPMIVCARQLWQHPLAPLLGAVLSIPVAHLSYRFVENRFRQSTGASSIRSLRPLLFSCTSLVAVSALVLALGAKAAWFQPTIAKNVTLIDQEHQARLRGCDQAPGAVKVDSGRCTWTFGAAGHVYVIGDSHGDHMSEAVLEAAKTKNLSVTITTASACPFHYLGVYDGPARNDWEDKRCHAFSERTLRWLGHQQPGTAIIASADTYWTTGTNRAPFGEPFKGDVEAGPRTYRRVLEESLSTLQAAGHRVVIVQSVPSMWFHPNYYDPRSCTTWAAAVDTCRKTFPRADFLAVQGRARETANDIAGRHGVKIVDPASVICPHETCSSHLDGELIYRDSTHITAAMSARLAPLVTAVLP